MLKGIAASQGIAVAKVYKLEQPVLEIVRKEAKAEEELAKLDAAFKKTVEDIEKIISKYEDIRCYSDLF